MPLREQAHFICIFLILPPVPGGFIPGPDGGCGGPGYPIILTKTLDPADAANPKVREWEALMDTFQQRLPFAKAGEKWVPMERIFKLE